MADSLAAPVVSGLVVGAAFVTLFAVSNTIPTLCGAPGLQISAPSLEQQIQYSEMIVYGTVISAELQPVHYYDQFGDFRSDLRYTVTVFVDRYMMDKSGEGAKIITFREYGFGCAYPFRSEVNTDNPFAVEHAEGDKAIFFIEKLDSDYLGRVEGDWSVFSLFDKYAVVGNDADGNKLVQSKYDARIGREPVTVARLESSINSFVRDESIIGN